MYNTNTGEGQSANGRSCRKGVSFGEVSVGLKATYFLSMK